MTAYSFDNPKFTGAQEKRKEKENNKQKPFFLQLELRESDDNGLLESNVEGSLETFPCVAQYVIFPPHVANSNRDRLELHLPLLGDHGFFFFVCVIVHRCVWCL